MTYFVSNKCVGCTYTDCVAPCPVNCFTKGKNCLLINADVCIDCGVCVDECPINAIVSSDEVNESIISKEYDNLDLDRKVIKFFYHLNIKYGDKWESITEIIESASSAAREPSSIMQTIIDFAENLSGEDLLEYREDVKKIFEIQIE